MFKVFRGLPFLTDVKDIDKFFFITEEGEIVYCFKAVACGHCANCLTKKLTSYMQRVDFAVQESREVPLFVTLTYNDRHLPVLGHCRRHLQRFKKRLKRNLENFLIRERHYDRSAARNAVTKVKFLCRSEYGHVDGRVHYHCLVFGFPRLRGNFVRNKYETTHFMQFCWRLNEMSYTSNLPYMSYAEYCKTYPQVFNREPYYDKWSFGFVNVEWCDDGTKVASYVCKYMCKDVDDVQFVEGTDPLTKKPYKLKTKYRTDGKLRNFTDCSRNLGVEFARSLQVTRGSVSYASFLDNTLHTRRLCAYYIDKLFPSPSRVVPSVVRKAYIEALLCASDVIANAHMLERRSIEFVRLNANLLISSFWHFTDIHQIPECDLISWNYGFVDLCIDLQRFNDLSDIVFNFVRVSTDIDIGLVELHRSRFFSNIVFTHKDTLISEFRSKNELIANSLKFKL